MKSPATAQRQPPKGGQPASEDQGNKRQSHGRTCVNCRVHRVRCDQRYPCSRCFRLCLKCRPPVRKRRTSRSKPGEGTGDEEGEADGSTQGPDELFIAAEAAAAATLEAHPLQNRLVDLVFQRARINPHALAEVVAGAGIRLFRAGLTSRELCILQMRKWLIKCRVCRGDATWGFLHTLMTEMGISQMELEATETLALEPTEEMRYHYAARELEKIMARMPELEGSFAWRMLNDERVGMYMNVVMEDGSLVELSNSMTKQLFRGIDELIGEDELKHGMLLNLLMLSLVAPEDRDTFASMILEMSLCETTRHITHVIKAFDRQGEIGLFLVEVRPLSSLRGALPGYVMRIEPCPPSHHVSATPGMHKAMAPFRPRNGGNLRASATAPPVWPPRLASRLPQSGEAGSGVRGSGSESGSGTAASLMLQPDQRAHPNLAYQHTVLAPAVTGMAALPLTCPPTEVAGTRSARQLAALFSMARGRAAVKEEVQPPPPPPPPPSRTLPPPPSPPPRLLPPQRSSGGGASAPLTGSSARVEHDEQVPAFDEALLEQVLDDDEATSLDESL